MRDIKQLHPELQKKIQALIELCQENGITIGIGECVRTVAEQDALYAKGRTAPGSRVTNAKGSTYSSMHQWGIGCDFYLKMDIDGDGQTSDDAFNNAKKTFNKVGALAKYIGLEWGGDWKSPVDLPHLQLPNWGSTAAKLKALYGTPEAFFKSWGGKVVDQTKIASNVTASKNKVEAAKSKDGKYSKTYSAVKGLNLRSGAGGKKDIITQIQKGEKVTCYGYYTVKGEKTWLFVAYGKYTGFVELGKLK